MIIGFLAFFQEDNTLSWGSVVFTTVERRLSEPNGGHTTRPDNRGIQIDEMESCSAKIWGSVSDNQ